MVVTVSKVIICVVFFALLGCVVNGRESKPSKKTWLKSGSKTRYQKKEFPFEAPEGCDPLHISMVIRHGTRYPSKKDVKKIERMLDVINKEIDPKWSNGDLYLPWKNPFSLDHDKLLASAGEEELYYLAKEFLKRFPSLLSHPYHPQNFDFISTGTSRTVQSAMAFAFGLFEGRGRLGPSGFQPVAIASRETNNDPILRFFDICPKYNVEVADNDTALHEYKKFKRGKEVERIGHKLSRLMTTAPDYSQTTFTAETIIGMYTACIFEVAIFNRESTWCLLFDEEDFLTLEYISDLKHYWKRGYGYPITYQIGCPLLENIVSNLKNATDPYSGERKYGNFMFAHSETLQPLYALLGLFKDQEELRAGNMNAHSRRKYRTSEIVPFGANIAFIAYSCNADDTRGKESDSYKMEQFKIQVFVNEELVALPCCGEQRECPLKTFLQCFDTRPNGSCNLSSLCRLESNTAENLHREL
ncbi:multiple inositol polyphosphate phosphatase 1-like [Stylophora pistillata]|uniref:multiple inositol polyphosphate phosphatase 1-like n=1 Tax=Stylophora pistillata TaxID=50429 RepID=UPI000C043DD7|nr:multiple inositol polyphosphate phosphatase 1-like [Stylophora pistillata]